MIGKIVKLSSNYEKIVLFLYSAVLVFLPFHRLISSYFVGLLTVFVLLSLLFTKKTLCITSDTKIALLPQWYYILIFLLSFLWTSDAISNLNILGRQISIIVLPLVTILIADILKRNNIIILLIFVFSNLLALTFLYFWAIYRHFWCEPLPSYQSYFVYTFFSVLTHPTFFSLYLNFSVVILLYFLRKTKNNRAKILIAIFIAIFAISIIQVSSRSGILTLILVLSFFVGEQIFRIKNRKIKILLILLTIPLIFLTINNHRFKTIIEEIKNPYATNKWHESRPLIWKNAFDVFLDNLFVGISPADAQAELNKNYISKYQYYSAAQKNLNAHNQYLQTAVEFGILGVLFLLAFIFVGFWIAIKSKNYIFVGFMFIVVLNSVFEALWAGVAGLLFIVVFYNFFSISFDKNILDTQIDVILNTIKK